MAARFIPTVERESIDLVLVPLFSICCVTHSRSVCLPVVTETFEVSMDHSSPFGCLHNKSVWNEELLGVGGYLSRTAYEKEMDHVSELWPQLDEGSEDVKSHLRARALHALKFFTFHASTPALQVATLLEETFFSCANTSSSPFAFLAGPKPTYTFPIMTSVGVRNVSDARLPNATFAEFLKQLPVLTEDVMNEAKRIVDCLRERGLIQQITFEDVLKELRTRPLTEVGLCRILYRT